MEKTTRERILESGRNLFLRMGFKSAPLRKIVADAGFTQGAFYGYFQTKEDLFYALTDEFAEKTFQLLDQVVEEINRIPLENRMFEMNVCYLRLLPKLVSHLCLHRTELNLVLKCAEGTKYEDLMLNLAERNTDQLKKILGVYFVMSKEEERLIRLLVNSYFSMLGQVVLEQSSEEDMLRMMTDIHTVFEKGVLGLFSARKREQMEEVTCL